MSDTFKKYVAFTISCNSSFLSRNNTKYNLIRIFYVYLDPNYLIYSKFKIFVLWSYIEFKKSFMAKSN